MTRLFDGIDKFMGIESSIGPNCAAIVGQYNCLLRNRWDWREGDLGDGFSNREDKNYYLKNKIVNRIYSNYAD